VILLFGVTDLDIWEDDDSRREVHSGVRMNASDLLEDVTLMAGQLFEIVSQRVEAIVSVVGVSVSS
jgi:hypothetical protein